MGIKTFQEKNTKPLEKELGQSELPDLKNVKKKLPGNA